MLEPERVVVKGKPNVRFGSKADMCSAQAHVRFTPIATAKADFQPVMSALPTKADMCIANTDVC